MRLMYQGLCIYFTPLMVMIIAGRVVSDSWYDLFRYNFEYLMFGSMAVYLMGGFIYVGITIIYRDPELKDLIKQGKE